MPSEIPFTREEIENLSDRFPTPFHIYDEGRIRQTAKEMKLAFNWAPDFKNYFAVKALPNPYILNILREEGMGADCSSLPELLLAEAVGMQGEDIMFTSNDTPWEEFVAAKNLGAVMNLDDVTHVETLNKVAGMPDLVSFRYNPGEERTGNSIIGEPVEAKYGVRRDQLIDGYKRARDLGATRFGLHTMVCSNERNVDYLADTAVMLFDLVGQVKKEAGVDISFVNLGGGIGIPYSAGESGVDLGKLSGRVQMAYQEYIDDKGLVAPNVVMECGRCVTGPHGWLVSRVRQVVEKHKTYVGLDACMTNLMRPALYGAHHEITVLGKEDLPREEIYDVTGSLCENNDKFAIDRNLPRIEAGDLLVIHDAGAHGHAMGFNYNGKLRGAEILRKTDGSYELIRRAETVKDYFSTLDFPGLRSE